MAGTAWLLTVLVCLVGADFTESARLLVLPKYGVDRTNGLVTVADSLARDGHDVTMLLPSCDGLAGRKPLEARRYKVKTIGVRMTVTEFESAHDTLVQQSLSDEPSFALLKGFSKTMATVCQQMFDNPASLTDLRGMKKFDLAIVDTASTCGLLFTSYFETPFIGFAFTTSESNQWHAPTPASYVPQPGTGLRDRMTFSVSERLQNTLMYLASDSLRDHLEYSFYRDIQTKQDLSRHLKIQNIQSQAKLWFWNSDFALDFPRPLMPHVIPVGAVTAAPAKPLSKDLNEFLEGSLETGTVIFSHVKDVGPELSQIIASALAKLPQRVVWRHTANHSTRLLVTHGGPKSVQESVYHGVPILCLPLFDEHFDLAVKVKASGIGDYMDIHTVTSETLHQKIADIITNTRYQQTAKKLSSMRKNKPLNATETVTYWVNYAVKHGTDHLISRAPNLKWYQYYLLDVAVSILAVVVFAVYVVRRAWRFIRRQCCRKEEKKAKRD